MSKNKKGLLICNHFLQSEKFSDIYFFLLEAAKRQNVELTLTTNANLSTKSLETVATSYDFGIFWDKDILLAQQLELAGMQLFNTSASIGKADNKALSYIALKKAELPMPVTIIAPKTFPNIGYTDLSFLQDVEEKLGFPMVLKECYGSFGQQVYCIKNRQELIEKVKKLADRPLLFQSLIHASYGKDVRINVVGGKVVASILRYSTNGDFRSNLTLGGSMEAYQPSYAEIQVALASVSALGLAFGGVDILFGEQGPLVCEVNSNAHFATTLACTGINMADEIIHHIITQQ